MIAYKVYCDFVSWQTGLAMSLCSTLDHVTYFPLLNFDEVITMSWLCIVYVVPDANVVVNIVQNNTHGSHDASLSVKYHNLVHRYMNVRSMMEAIPWA